MVEGGAKTDDSPLQSPMPFVDLGVAALSAEVSLNTFMQVALIAFEGS